MNDLDNINNFDKVFIENKIKDHKNIKKILKNIKINNGIEYINNIQKTIKNIPLVYHPEERSKYLLLSSIRGEILQKCPGSHGHICCNYYVINLYIGCPIGCTYCILQSYLNQPFIIINVDIEIIFEELQNIFKNNRTKLYRIGTGELGDSLAYDKITGFSKDFIEFFSKQKNAYFEFKTKTDFIDELLDQKGNKNIVVGFSVNPQSVIDKEEGMAVTLDKRIQAAKKLAKAGYKLAFHFDPIFNINDFENEYNKVINMIFDNIDGEKISYISLGTFRYTPDLKNMIEYNYKDSNIIYDEFVENYDKKYRYFKPIRTELYSKIAGKIKRKNKNILLYLCMESPYIWEKTLGLLPFKENKMDLVFSDALSNDRGPANSL